MPLQATSGAASYDAFGGGALVVAQQAEAVDYDGTNDYLTRSSDLTGNTNTSTITFSTWVWVNEAPASSDQIISIAAGNFEVTIDSSLQVQVVGFNGTAKLNATATTLVPLKTWCNIVMSFDMTDTAKRAIYINDAAASVTWTTYVSSTLATVGTPHRVAGISTQIYMGRLSTVYLDYTYRDLSVTANRRLFITADLKPAAGQAALNPIMYLPMSDPTAPGKNTGTGGDFTLTGVVARSGRGPNQYNAPYSDLDGAADYLSRTTAPTGIADGKQFTLAFTFNSDTAALQYVLDIGTSATLRFSAYISIGGTTLLTIVARNSSNTGILSMDVVLPTATVVNRNYNVVVSVDLANTANRYVYVNGVAASVTWTTYTNDLINFLITTTPRYRVGASIATTPGSFLNGRLGALWFNTNYIDLSVPANLAKFVSGTGINAAPVDLGATGELPTGTSPRIYLPMYGNNAGKNYGTGGDFTVNSGPYTGARGPNEFWGNKATFDGSTGYLSIANALSGVSNSKTFSCSFFIAPTSASVTYFIFSTKTSTFSWRFIISRWSTGDLQVSAYNSAGSQVLVCTGATVDASGSGHYIQMSVDLTSTSKRSLYIDGVAQTPTWSVYTNDFISFTDNNGCALGARATNFADKLNGKLSEFYFTTDYIDFSQEANRLKFRDAFGNPVDLTQQIEDGAIPNPAIYMRFPPTSFGTNSGTGGNFTVNGTITDGGNL